MLLWIPPFHARDSLNSASTGGPGAAMTTTATQPAVLFEQQGRVGLITLNRPERLNAWTREMAHMLLEYVERCNADDGVGAIVLTGAGRGFCSGADLRPEPAAD